ncbi:conserved hypothetical protein [Paenibacillus curdlanolyticus YK9]|uniref:FlxA-like protein n=1 Tax=Paenibacillus curdlanolyticus YK9 TaxID=717606 RepID=E0IG52_9BACL|nr:FlxA-like family protein [Paenibacillus curdlanolyticus]EFM08632.1 conserved hypothetical protein [Paenibacillus curdlanolyticus YK9]
MSIASVSGRTSTAYSANASTASNTADLEKQRTALQAEIRKEQQSKDDQKSKNEKLQQLQQQLQQIELQIAQKRSSASGSSGSVNHNGLGDALDVHV